MLRWVVGLLAVLMLLGIALPRVPARVAGAFLEDSPVSLSGFSGSLFEGHAARALFEIAGGAMHLGSVGWSVDGLSVLRLRPALTLESAWGAQRIAAKVKLAGNRVDLKDVDARIPAALIRQFLPLELGGTVQLQLQELSVDLPETGQPEQSSATGAGGAGPGLRSAQGRLVWEKADWQTTTGSRRLGSYVAELDSGQPGTLRAQVLTLSGPVNVSGEAQLLDGRYDIDLLIRGDQGPLAADLAQALSLLAIPEGDGYRLKLEGELAAAGPA
ncbi:MAG: type II secretion system protein N [Pseudomonadota bacterium]